MSFSEISEKYQIAKTDNLGIATKNVSWLSSQNTSTD